MLVLRRDFPERGAECASGSMHHHQDLARFRMLLDWGRQLEFQAFLRDEIFTVWVRGSLMHLSLYTFYGHAWIGPSSSPPCCAQACKNNFEKFKNNQLLLHTSRNSGCAVAWFRTIGTKHLHSCYDICGSITCCAHVTVSQAVMLVR